MNKIQMTEIIKFIAKIVQQNDNINFNDKTDCRGIYRHLTQHGVDTNKRDVNIENEGFFSKWIEHFKNKEKINVFVDPRWSYFCQFTNEKYRNEDYIKIYLPTKYECLYENANIIFEYLRKENISHVSKIAKEIRFDNIVIRLTNKKDADKLLMFVNGNPQLKNGLSEPNPFAFTTNNIAMVCDGNLSYNSIVASYIGMYVQHKKNTNQLDNVNSDDFINFVKNFYQDVFEDKKYYNLCNDFFDINLNLVNNTNAVNFKNITELIIKSYQDNFTYDDLISHFNKCNDPSFIKKEADNISKNKTDEELLQEYFEIMGSKYGEDVALNSLIMFIKAGDNRAITRDNNLRFKITQSGIYTRLNDYFNKNKFSINDIRNYLKKFVNITTVTNDISSQTQELLTEYLEVMTNKYGINIASGNLNLYLLSGRTDNITRDNDLRRRISESKLREELKAFFQNNNYTYDEINDWIMNYYNNLGKKK